MAMFLMMAIGYGHAGSAVAQITVIERRPGAELVGGVVREPGEGRPVANPNLMLLDSTGATVGRSIGTENGEFSLPFRQGGTYLLVVDRIGYAGLRGSVVCRPGETLALSVEIERHPVAVEGIIVRAPPTPRTAELSRRGFEARRSRFHGFFMDEAEIRERRPSRLTDLVARVPGATVLRVGGRIADISLTRNQGGSFRAPTRPCVPAVWLDGVRVREGGIADDDLIRSTQLNDLIPPEDIGALEVYAGVAQVPAQFRGLGAACGVVVIWSK